MDPRSLFAAVLAACLGACSATALDAGTAPEPADLPVGEAAWPMLAAGPEHTARSASRQLPGTTRRWDVALGDAVHTSPVIAGDGTVYVASDHALHAVSESGALRWRVPIALLPESSLSERDPRVREELPSPAIDRHGLVYVRNGAALDAYRPDGVLHARHVFGSEGIASSPTIAPDGTLYVATWDGALRALAPEGERILRAEDTAGSGRSWSSTPTLADDVPLLFVENAHDLYAASVHVVDGGVSNWFTSAGTTDYSFQAYVAAGPLLQLASRRGLHGFDADGEQVFYGYASAIDWTQSNLAVARDGISYVAFHSTDADARFHMMRARGGFDHAGIAPALTAFDPEGQVVWQRDLGDAVRALAIASDGTLYAAGQALHKLDSSGRSLSRLPLARPCVTPLAIDHDGTALFVTDDGVLRAR